MHAHTCKNTRTCARTCTHTHTPHARTHTHLHEQTRDTTGVTASEPTVGPSLQLLNVFSALHTLGCTLAAALEPPAAPATPGGGDGGDGSGSEAGGGAAVDTEDTDPLKDVDQALVAQLGEMGFPANRAGKALVITGGDFGAVRTQNEVSFLETIPLALLLGKYMERQ